MKRIILAVVLSMSSFVLEAATYSITFEGVLTFSGHADYSVGELFSFQFEIDDESAPLSSTSHSTRYQATSQGNAEIGGNSFLTSNPIITIYNDNEVWDDRLTINLSVIPNSQIGGQNPIDYGFISFLDTTATAFNDTNLSNLLFLDFGLFEYTSFNFYSEREFEGADSAGSRNFSIVEISPTPIPLPPPPTVPIPAAVYLFGSALGLLGWMRRKTT